MTQKEGAGRTVLVTGASAGIGTELSRVFAENGFDVVLTARREDRLRDVASVIERDFGVKAHTIAADLADVGAPSRLFEETERRGIQIDALVNNAGYGVARRFRNNDWQTHATFMQVMITAVLQLTHLYERGMTARGYGRIMNVSSLAAFLPGTAGHTLYTAAKSFLVKFTESLALEHPNDDVNVCALCPGFTHTEFHGVLGNLEMVNKLPPYMWMDAPAVAHQGYRALMDGKIVFVPGRVNRAIAGTVGLLPESVALGVLKRQAKRLRIAE